MFSVAANVEHNASEKHYLSENAVNITDYISATVMIRLLQHLLGYNGCQCLSLEYNGC